MQKDVAVFNAGFFNFNNLRHSSDLLEDFENTQVDRPSNVSPKRGRPSRATASAPDLGLATRTSHFFSEPGIATHAYTTFLPLSDCHSFQQQFFAG